MCSVVGQCARVAGIDVHKRMLDVVVSDVEVDGSTISRGAFWQLARGSALTGGVAG